MGLLFALGTWWFLLAQRLTTDYFGLVREKLLARASDAAVTMELSSLDQKIDRRLFMLSGEVALFFALLVICIGVLYIVARQKRVAVERMERMLQMTTHELKTPIAGVKALLQSFKLGSIPEAARGRMLDQGIRECDRLSHLTESLLAYQRAVARVSSRTSPHTVSQLVSSVLDGRSQTFGDEALVSGLNESETLVLADRDAFRVVLENLLDNAKKYGGANGIMVEGNKRGDHYALAIVDKGVGFDPKFSQKLFTPFERGTADQGNTRGSGLGLFIARSLAHSMKGELTAESPGVGCGSTFTLQLPLSKESTS
jgi:signal transduction histidine kinase